MSNREILPVIALVGLVLSFATAGCQLLGSRTFLHTFPAEAGIDRLDVELTDQSGSVLRIGRAPDGFQPITDMGFAPLPGNPNAIVVHWIGGTCDTKVAITVRPQGQSLLISHRTVRRPGPCDGLGVSRALLIELTMTAEPRNISLEVEA